MYYSRKNQTRGKRTYFFENPPGIFIFFTLPRKIPDKTKLHHWKFLKIMSDPLKVPKPETKTPGNSALVFLGYPWKLHFVFI